MNSRFQSKTHVNKSGTLPSITQISKQLGISYGTAWNYVQRVKAGHTS
jgi:molybdenum-dependent DNA-binding transcriptional regulator ModE